MIIDLLLILILLLSLLLSLLPGGPTHIKLKITRGKHLLYLDLVQSVEKDVATAIYL